MDLKHSRRVQATTGEVSAKVVADGSWLAEMAASHVAWLCWLCALRELLFRVMERDVYVRREFRWRANRSVRRLAKAGLLESC